MRLADAGWVWEGQGLDPGVHPSIFGVGEGATYFGLQKVHYLFHPNDAFALEKLRDKEAVICDISKWCFRDAGESGKGSECYCEGGLDHVLTEADNVGRLAQAFPNLAGAFYDDMKGLMQREGHGGEDAFRVRRALQAHHPDLVLECVVYAHELEDACFWRCAAPAMDVVSFWVWGFPHLEHLERYLDECRALFPDKPIRMGCYLRDYPSAQPIPMEVLRRQWELLPPALEDGRINGFDILGTVLIDGQREQAAWVRDFIRAHS